MSPVPEHVRKIGEEVKGLPLREALRVIEDRLLQPSDYAKVYLSSILKESNPALDYEKIFELLGYSPDGLKSTLWSLHEFRQVVSGQRGRRIFVGWWEIDSLIRGIRPGQVMGVMARAGVGKTAFAINAIHNVFAREDPHAVLFLSLEMPAAEVVARLFSIDSGEPAARLEAYLEKSDADPRLAAWTRRYQDLVIFDRAGLSMPDICRTYQEAVEYLGQEIPLVIIDYLQLLRAPGPTAYERTSRLARQLKEAAKAMNTVLVVLIQTSRVGGTGREPVTLTAARDSGAIEEALDYLIAIWRPEMGRGGVEPLKVALLKNRHGPTGEVRLWFDPRTLRITSDWEDS